MLFFVKWRNFCWKLQEYIDMYLSYVMELFKEKLMHYSESNCDKPIEYGYQWRKITFKENHQLEIRVIKKVRHWNVKYFNPSLLHKWMSGGILFRTHVFVIVYSLAARERNLSIRFRNNFGLGLIFRDMVAFYRRTLFWNGLNSGKHKEVSVIGLLVLNVLCERLKIFKKLRKQ